VKSTVMNKKRLVEFKGKEVSIRCEEEKREEKSEGFDMTKTLEVNDHWREGEEKSVGGLFRIRWLTLSRSLLVFSGGSKSIFG
jgi:hypothetical protein